MQKEEKENLIQQGRDLFWNLGGKGLTLSSMVKQKNDVERIMELHRKDLKFPVRNCKILEEKSRYSG